MKEIFVWNRFVRIWHWLLVMNIFILLTSGVLEKHKLHAVFGILTVTLAFLRLYHGFFGKGYSLFSSFIKSPKQVVDYTMNLLKKKEENYIGHNPLAGYVMTVIIFAIIITGFVGMSVFIIDNELFASINSLENIDKINKTLSKIHSAISFIISGSILLHIAGVIRHIYVKKENIIKSMINGKKIIQQKEEI